MRRGYLFKPRRCLAWGLFLLLAAGRTACAVDPPLGEGEPFLQYFSSHDYHANTQCPCAVQDARGVMYIGNIGSVLEYDGSSWHKIDVGELHAVAGMAYDTRTDTIFVGARDDVGYLKNVPGGTRVFVSLLDQLPPEARDVGVVFGVYATPDGVFFVATDRVLRWRDGRFKTWSLAPTSKLRSSWADGHLYVFSREIGLQRLENETFVPASTDPLFRRASTRSVLVDADGNLVVATAHDGMFVLRDGVIRPLDSDTGDFLKEKGILKALLLRDGSLAIATDAAGLVVLDRARRFRSHVDETGGLHGTNLMNLFEDAEGGLWISLGSGITRAEVNSPLSILRAGPEDDFPSVIADDNPTDKMLVSSTTGLYRFVPARLSETVGAHLEKLPGIPGVDAFCVVANGVLAVVDTEVVLFDAEGRPVPVSTGVASPITFLASRVHPGRVFVGGMSGMVGALHLDAASGQWVDDGLVASTGESGEFRMVESARGDLWLGTKDHGLYRAEFASAGPAAVTSYLSRPGPLQGKRYVIAYNNGGAIIFNALSSLCCLDASGQNVQLLSEFGPRFTDGSLNFYNLLSADRNSLWIIATDIRDQARGQVCGRAVAGEDGREPTFQPLPHKVTDELGELTDYLVVGNGPDRLNTLLLAGAEGHGIVRLDVRQWEAQLASARPFATLIRRAVIAGPPVPGRPSEPILEDALPYARNSVHFEFAAGTVAFGASPRFQTRLANFGAGDWSDFTDRNSVDYLNLPEGRYTFEVRARNADGLLGSVASLPFRVLPPWQRTPWAYTVYGLALAAALAAFIRWRGRQLRRRNVALATLVDARTSELRGRETELVRARDDAEQANRAKSAFLANMSHELRTPLNAVLGYTQLLLKQADLTPRSRERIAVIGQSGGHLLSLVNEVLDLSKVEAGKLTLSPFDFSLHQLLDEVAAAFRPRFAEKRLTFTETRAPGLPTTVHTDPSRLRQVLFNLLSNAVKFTERGGVTSKVFPTDERCVRFEVTDTGVGIEAKEQRDIFVAFHQAGESRLASQGTGLGLTISQRLVELLGGRIEVESTPGQGSRFWFDLPLFEPEPSDGSPPRPSHDPALGKVTGYEGATRRLLLVDDLTENRRVLRDFLQPLGFEIAEAVDGTECLAACARQMPDAVLLDLRLGTPDGFEVARSLRARLNGAPLGIIAISASVFESDRQQAVDAGCDDFLPKPFEEAQLLGVLGRVLGLRWMQATPVETHPSASDSPAGGERALPPDETNVLLELSLRGDAAGIRRRLDALRAADLPAGPTETVRQLDSLVAAFDMEGIHELLLAFRSHDGN